MSTTTRTAIVTGAAQGIGAGITRSLLEAGMRVVAVDRDTAALEGLAAEVGDADRLLTQVGDVASTQTWTDAVAAAHDHFGPVHVLVNNAGISPKKDGRRVPSDQLDLEEWNRVLAVNLTSAFLGFSVTVADMISEGWGRIVNISSTAAQQGARVAGLHYGASKAGMLGLTRTLAWEFGGSGITVNAVTPGRIITPMAAQVSDEVNERMLAAIPVARFGAPDDIGSAVAYLASEEAGFVTGVTLSVNGGAYIG
jgi:3-oxoacyl-[acyl-carrier protein] reductase